MTPKIYFGILHSIQNYYLAVNQALGTEIADGQDRSHKSPLAVKGVKWNLRGSLMLPRWGVRSGPN